MRIVIVGGGSRQWGPKLTADILTTPSLTDATIVLHDIDEASLAPMQAYCERMNREVGAAATIEATTDRRAALDGADFVAVTISTGGFTSMAHDLEIPERYGVRQSVGDTCGPGGINRSLRNIPVLLDIARDMEAQCPDAWLMNLTNPMTCLTRAINKETSIKAVGLCHEVVIMSWLVAIALGVPADHLDFTITGVNHLPWITKMSVNGEDGFEALRRALADRPEETAWFADEHQLKLAMLDRFGALPGAGDRHVAEFFPSILTEEAEWGKAWGVALTSIADRERDEAAYRTEIQTIIDGDKPVPTWQSGEMVAPIIDSLTTGTRRELPLNLPNIGQAPYLPDDVVVETICIVDADGIRGRDAIVPPAPCAEWTRRHVAVQELTVEAAVTGDADLVRAAIALDPLGGRIDARAIEAMSTELLAATAEWLPQFAG
ncbi:MAG: galacturan 1,4-alpha-galacturonidase [Acidimicrobiaceae bacterium]|jgi:alpha-galactosidase